MAALQCEICGGKLMAKSGGLFECEYCGMQYDKTRIQEMVQEIKGTVKVEGTVQVAGTVKVAGPVEVKGGTNVENFLKRGKLLLEDQKWNEAQQAFDAALELDAECGEAYIGLAMCDQRVNKLDLLVKRNNWRSDKNFKRGKQFASDELKQAIERIEQEQAEKRIAQAKAEQKKENVELAKSRVNLVPVRKRIQKAAATIAAGGLHTVGLRLDGTVVAAGSNYYGQCEVSDWSDCIAVSAGSGHTVALKEDGTVLATGDNEHGQCNVFGWRGCIAVAAGNNYTIGLKSDGTVLATGWNGFGQCDVYGWQDCIAIAAGGNHTVGLKSDGTVVAVGNNDSFKCEVSHWRDCVAIAAGRDHTVGLKADGTVLVAGPRVSKKCDVGKWRDCVAIAAGTNHTAALKADGTVVVTGDGYKYNIFDMCNTVAISVGDTHIVVANELGSVRGYGESCRYSSELANWDLFDSPDTIDKDRAKAKLAKKRRAAGLCQHCGGSFKGLFTKKCINCGKAKDYT